MSADADKSAGPDAKAARDAKVTDAKITEKIDQIDELLRIIGQLKIERQQERDRTDRLEKENDRLNTIIQEWVVPALHAGKRAAEESRELLDCLQKERVTKRAAERDVRHGKEVA